MTNSKNITPSETEASTELIGVLIENFFSGAYDSWGWHSTPYQIALNRIVRYHLEHKIPLSSKNAKARLLKIVKASDWTYAHELARCRYIFSVQDLLALGNPLTLGMWEHEGWTVAHEMAKQGFIFKFADLLALKNAKTIYYWSIAHEMARRNHFFTIDELIQLGNPSSENGWTVAHQMACSGYSFDLPALLALGNPALKSETGFAEHGDVSRPAGWTIAHEMVKQGYIFSFSDLVALGNPAYFGKRTVAHMMAAKGHPFSISELKALGNPQDKNGWTVAHLMLIRGHRFPVKELDDLGNVTDIKATEIVGVHLTYRDGLPVFAEGEKLGKEAVLSFGTWMMGDILCHEVSYSLRLVSNKTDWYVKMDVQVDTPYQTEFLSHQSKVSKLMDEINDAIRNHDYYDLSEFVRIWENLKEEFSLVVSSGNYINFAKWEE